MPDPSYKNVNFILESKGISARAVDDTLPPGTFLNEGNCEELAENSVGPRLGSKIINKTGGNTVPLAGPVHSLAKLASLNDNNYRYAGASDLLYRRPGLTAGPYTQIASGLSKQPWSAAVDVPNGEVTAFPYVFIADANRMLKDQGTLAAPQQMGMFQPRYPVVAVIEQPPTMVVIDDFSTPASDYTYAGISGGTNEGYVNTTVESSITAGSIQLVQVASLVNIYAFQLLTINSSGPTSETVMVLAAFSASAGVGGKVYFIQAYFANSHNIGESITAQSLSVTVPQSTTASIASSGSVATAASATIQASQWATNLTFNAAQYTYVAPQLRTTGAVSGGTLTDYIICSGLNLGIPSDATITGVQVALNWVGQNGGTGILTNVALYHGGVITGAVKSPNTQNLSVSSSATQGGMGDLWGAALTPAIVNDATFGFGVQITANNVSGTTRSFINWMSVTVYFTRASSGSGTFPALANENLAKNQSDYVALQLFVEDPALVQSITLKFDCGDGSFNTDYFYKVIAQGPLQNLLNDTTDAATASTDAILSSALNVFGNSPEGIVALNTGLNGWNTILCQLSDFAGAGRAEFSDPVYNWTAVNGWQIVITTNDRGSCVLQFSSLILFGGAGPDVFAGVGYDYVFTFYNAVDGTESNPSMFMTNVNPPFPTTRVSFSIPPVFYIVDIQGTNWVYPRRMPVKLTLTYPDADPQATHLRIYRRGGTLGDNFRRIDQVAITGSPQTYDDVRSDSDIQQNDFVSLVNDVPVTSLLQAPINSTLTGVITPAPPGQLIPINLNLTTTANLYVGQQLELGNPVSDNFETVIIQSVSLVSGFVQLSGWVQNRHEIGELVSVVTRIGQPVNLMASAYGQMWFAGDPNNPNYLYWSARTRPQAVGQANFVAVSTPDDPITAIVPYKGNLYVSTVKGWWAIAPGASSAQSPTVYATAARHGCIAPHGWIATEEAIFYQANDGIRAFGGGASQYLTQSIEFIFQNVGSSPIIQADMTQLDQTRMAFWNAMIFVSYIGVDGNRHRVILHAVYKRWRNDDIDAQSILLEPETNTLVFGDSEGLVHTDREIRFTDEGDGGGVVSPQPIAVNLQTPYTDVGEPSIKKCWQELTLDINTAGETLTIILMFEDGQTSVTLSTVTTTTRQKVNFNLNNGAGYEFYKVSVRLIGNTSAAWYLYQCSIKYLPLAKTRKSFDTYKLRLGIDESKIAKQLYFEYSSAADINFSVYYDDSTTAGFTFTLKNSGGVRNPQRVRLPAVAFRIIRLIGTSSADFQIWEESKIEVKYLCQGKSYLQMDFVPNG